MEFGRADLIVILWLVSGNSAESFSQSSVFFLTTAGGYVGSYELNDY